MSEQTPDEKLQFDKAEFEEDKSSARCGVCGNTLSGQYFTVNMASTCTACTACTESTRQHFSVAPKFSETLKSILFGIAAGIAGSLVYYLVLKLTGYEIGLIAILVGYLVGRAVMIGSGHRGGLRYRIIAVIITYLAIISTYVPMVIEGIRQSEKNQRAALPSGAAPVPVTPQNSTVKPPALKSQEKGSPEMTTVAPEVPPTFGEFALAVATFAGFMLALPFLSGIENIIGILITAFALFEAARRTAKPKLEIFGPFTISEPRADA